MASGVCVVLADAARRHESKAERAVALVRRFREPVILFTEFRDSLEVLRRLFGARHGDRCLHGGQTPGERRGELARFLTGTASVLIATDVASLGLNLQTRARVVVNLELPWNPIRLEQRAGRVDRIGQTRSVHVTLLVAPTRGGGARGHSPRRAHALCTPGPRRRFPRRDVRKRSRRASVRDRRRARGNFCYAYAFASLVPLAAVGSACPGGGAWTGAAAHASVVLARSTGRRTQWTLDAHRATAGISGSRWHGDSHLLRPSHRRGRRDGRVTSGRRTRERAPTSAGLQLRSSTRRAALPHDSSSHAPAPWRVDAGRCAISRSHASR